MKRSLVLILDFGSQYTQLIARRVRELGVYSEVIPGNAPLAEIVARRPGALILSGSPASGYRAEAPLPDPGIYALGTPLLGICYGFQATMHVLGGRLTKAERAEYGMATFVRDGASPLFEGVPKRFRAWMSHGDEVQALPPGWVKAAHTANAQFAVWAVFTQPSGSACTSSPWLIHARNRFGTPSNSGEAPSRTNVAMPYSARSAFASEPPSRWTVAWKP